MISSIWLSSKTLLAIIGDWLEILGIVLPMICDPGGLSGLLVCSATAKKWPREARCAACGQTSTSDWRGLVVKEL